MFQARRRRRIDLAERWLGDIRKTPESLWLAARAEAAIEEAKGDPEGALEKLEQVEQAILAFPNEAQREVSLRAVKRWQADLRTQSGVRTKHSTDPALARRRAGSPP